MEIKDLKWIGDQCQSMNCDDCRYQLDLSFCQIAKKCSDQLGKVKNKEYLTQELSNKEWNRTIGDLYNAFKHISCDYCNGYCQWEDDVKMCAIVRKIDRELNMVKNKEEYFPQEINFNKPLEGEKVIRGIIV